MRKINIIFNSKFFYIIFDKKFLFFINFFDFRFELFFLEKDDENRFVDLIFLYEIRDKQNIINYLNCWKKNYRIKKLLSFFIFLDNKYIRIVYYQF